jgi:pyridoxal 5'-phosphate synthase pdxS subunit
MDLLEQIEKGIIVEIKDVKEAISVDKIAHGVIIRNFDLELIDETLDAISIPVIASCRVGHFIEAKILEKMGVAMIDESNPNEMEYIDKKIFSIPFVCKVESMEEATKRIEEGAAAVRTEFGSIDEVSWIIREAKNKNLEAKIFASLDVATPADIALLFQEGCHAIIISSALFRSPNPPKLLDAIVKAARYYNDIEKIFLFSKSINKILPSQAK